LRRLTLGLLTLGLLTFSIWNVADRQAGAAQGTVAPATHTYVPDGIPLELWRKSIPADNPMTAEKVALGQSLYFDKRLSADGTVSCATCHDPARAFADANTNAVGVGGKAGARNAPTILNAMFNEAQFWDGRVRTLEEQLKQPLLNPLEMGMPSAEALVARVTSDPDYRQRFRRMFRREGITIDTIAQAIRRLRTYVPFGKFTI
jgi:cytochrome c peroxidase